MSAFDFTPLGESPGREKICREGRRGSLLDVFPPEPLPDHFGAGYTFRPEPCPDIFNYNPDFCPSGIQPSDLKSDPQGFGPDREAIVGVIETAFHCPPVGETFEGIRQIAEDAVRDNLWRAVEQDLIAQLSLEAIPQGVGAVSATCALAQASQFLAEFSKCGRGVIVGPYGWIAELGNFRLFWDGDSYKDLVGNIIIPILGTDDTVFAFDSDVDIKTSEIIILDELAPAIRTVNDRIIRAEQIYTVAIDPCVVGSFVLSGCCPCQ